MSYIVYKHTCPNGKVYIGITKQAPNKRWLNGLGYEHNNYFFKAIKKYGWQNLKHEILFYNLNEKKAKEKEIELIKYFKSNQREYGYNITDGGDGVHGFKHTEETLSKIHNLFQKGCTPWNKGKTTPVEVKEKLSKAHKGKPSLRKGCKLSKKEIELHAQAVSKITYQYDLEDNLIKVWNSIKEAATTLNLKSGNIASCCSGKRKTAYGFIWKH
ncbi:MAG: hypothetical protein IJJ10_06605 [Bacillus sp. (in: Bacteria)]|nr:hypothetical protein [Bacillus sp. (in: firmicutes)]